MAAQDWNDIQIELKLSGDLWGSIQCPLEGLILSRLTTHTEGILRQKTEVSSGQ